MVIRPSNWAMAILSAKFATTDFARSKNTDGLKIKETLSRVSIAGMRHIAGCCVQLF